MTSKEKRPMGLAPVLACLLTLASAASAEDKSANNMPTKNPWLHDSFNPISHENPAQTDAVNIASGTIGRRLGIDDAKVLYTDIEASHHILKNIGDKQVAYFSAQGHQSARSMLPVRTLS